MLGVPASNLCGMSFQVAESSWTTRIISPPPLTGSIRSSSSGFATRNPTPVGPYALWAENARKSTPSAWKSTGMCGTDCAPSTTITAPTRWAAAAISAIGLIVPSTLDIAVSDDDPRARRQHRGNAAMSSSAVAGDRDVAQHDAALAREHDPRHQVGVVLHLGEQHLVARRRASPPTNGPPG